MRGSGRASGFAGDAGEAGTPGSWAKRGPRSGTDATILREHVTTGPGLKLAVQDATIDANGVVTVDFTITDGAGVPLDLTGTYTDGAVIAEVRVSWLADPNSNGSPGAYTAYTLQTHKSVDGTKSGADARLGHERHVRRGRRRPRHVHVHVRHAARERRRDQDAHRRRVGDRALRRRASTSRTRRSTSCRTASAVTNIRDIVTTSACNQCHNPLAQHEDGTRAPRREAVRSLPHDAGRRSVSNGNALDMSAYDPQDPPRQERCRACSRDCPYQLTEDNATFDDHSDTWFPAGGAELPDVPPGLARTGRVAEVAVTRTYCGACHDGTVVRRRRSRAGSTMHTGGVQNDDSQC